MRCNTFGDSNFSGRKDWASVIVEAAIGRTKVDLDVCLKQDSEQAYFSMDFGKPTVNFLRL